VLEWTNRTRWRPGRNAGPAGSGDWRAWTEQGGSCAGHHLGDCGRPARRRNGTARERFVRL